MVTDYIRIYSDVIYNVTYSIDGNKNPIIQKQIKAMKFLVNYDDYFIILFVANY